MNKPSELRAAIQAVLDGLHPRVFYQAARGNPEFPYLVWDLTRAFDDGNTEVYLLEVDGWDQAKDTTALEDLMETVDGDGDLVAPSGLHRRVLNVPGQVAATIYRESRQSIPDEDDRIRRRRYTYEVRVIN